MNTGLLADLLSYVPPETYLFGSTGIATPQTQGVLSRMAQERSWKNQQPSRLSREEIERLLEEQRRRQEQNPPILDDLLRERGRPEGLMRKL